MGGCGGIDPQLRFVRNFSSRKKDDFFTQFSTGRLHIERPPVFRVFRTIFNLSVQKPKLQNKLATPYLHCLPHVLLMQFSLYGYRDQNNMADSFSSEQRSRLMARIKGKNTKPERIVRSLIHNMGYRFRLHSNNLPGKPDIVLPRHRKIVFVHGCFWHHHTKCRKGCLPSTNMAFWENKIFSNVERDKKTRRKLKEHGWRVLIVWECELRKIDDVISKLELFLKS